MVAAQSPTIAKIKNEASGADARALLYIAICEVCDFFNVGKTMNDTQVALTIDLIIEQYWYLKLEEIKYCFRRAMRTERLFDRLDGNIILGWLKAYDDERTEEAIRISDQKESEIIFANHPTPQDISFSQYLASLSERQTAGDKTAAEILKQFERMTNDNEKQSNKTANEIAYKKYLMEYIGQKKAKI